MRVLVNAARWLLSALFLLVVAVGVLLYLVLATPTGLSQGVALAARFVPALDVERTEGRLVDRFALHGVAWDDGSTRARVGRVALDWSPRTLLSFDAPRLVVNALDVDTVDLALPPPEPEPEPEPLEWPPEIPEVQLPVAFDIARVGLTDVHVRDANGATLQRVESVTLSARGAGETLEVTRLEVALPQGTANATASARLGADRRATLDARFDLSLGERVTGEAKAELVGDRLRIDAATSAPLASTLAGTVDALQPIPALVLDLAWNDVRWPLGEDEALVAASDSGTLRLDGALDDLKIALASDIDAPAAGPQIAPERVALDARIDISGLLPWLDRRPRTITTTTSLNVEGALPVSLEADVHGPLERLVTTLGVDTQVPELGPARIDYRGTVTPQHIEIETFALTQDEARANFAGTVGLGDATTVAVDGEWRDLAYPLESGMARSPAGTLSVNGTTDALDVKARIEVDMPPVGAATLAYRGSVGPERVRIDALTLKQAEGRAEFEGEVGLGEMVAIALNGEWRDLSYPLESGMARSPAGTLSVKGTKDALAVDTRIEVDVPPVGAATLAYRGNVGPERVRIDALTLEQGVGRAAFEGEVGLGEPLSLALDGRWNDLAFPLAQGVARSDAGEIRVSGPPQALEVEASAAFEVPDVPPGQLDARATVDTEGGSAQLASVGVDILGGRIAASGNAGWLPAPRWDLSVNIENIAPGVWPGLGDTVPGEVSSQLTSKGKIEDGEPLLAVVIERFAGTLRGYPVGLSGRVDVAGTSATLEGVRLRSGENRVAVGGIADDERLDVAVKLDAPRLDTVWPGLTGRIGGNIDVQGPTATPRVALDIDGAGVGYEATRIARLRARGSADLAGASDLRVEVNGISGPVDVSRAVLSLNGTPAQHTLNLDVDAAPASASVRLAGGAETGGAPSWDGRIEQLGVTPKGLSRWQLASPAPLSLSASSANLGQACLTPDGQGGRACVAADWRAAAGDTPQAVDAKVSLDRLPLALARPFLPPDVRIQGGVSGTADAAIVGEAIDARVSLSPSPGSIDANIGAADRVQLDYRFSKFDVRVADGRANADIAVTAGPARVNVDVTAGLTEGGPLEGRVQTNIEDLQPLLAGVTAVAQPRGKLNLDARLGGSTRAPAIDGRLSFTNGRFSVPDAGITLDQVTFDVRNRGTETLVIDGGLESGGGRLDIDGQVRLDAARGFPTELKVRGSDLQVARLPTVVAYASPDVTLTRDASRTRLTGEIVLPRAEVRLTELPPGVTRISPDEVIVGGDRAPKKPATGGTPTAPLDVDLRVRIGEAVTFDGFGLLTRVDGALDVRGRAGRAPQANGQLNLRDGTFEGYGQDLEIRRGRFLFAGPLGNPGIDLEAVRVSGDVTAGIRLDGPARKPRATLFSTPPLPQAEQLSYLVTGRGLSGGGRSESANLGAAAAALGLAQTSELQRSIGARLGVDEFGLQSDGDLDSTGLAIGKRLTPALTMRFVVGLFDAVGSVLLDYELTDNISIEASTGQRGQGVDLLYELER